jgi:hypothetical protein
MPRPSRAPRADAVCGLAAAGSVGAATLAHIAAGGPRPPVALLLAAVVGSALLARLLPVRARGPRGVLVLAVGVQPLLHLLFALAPDAGRGSWTGVGAGMPAAHALAAVAGVWWWRTGARTVVAVGGAAIARWFAPLGTLVVRDRRDHHRPSPRGPRRPGRDACRVRPVRGPPGSRPLVLLPLLGPA